MKCIYTTQGISHVILDRDGTLIEHTPYLSSPTQVVLLPKVKEGLALLKKADCRLFLHTNQSGIGRGYFTLEDAQACNREMIKQIGLGDDIFDAICLAPEHPDAPSRYRKPSPAWAQELMQRKKLSANSICYVGDTLTDMQTADNCGCIGLAVGTGLCDIRSELTQANLPMSVYDTFLSAAEYIVSTHHE